MHSRHVVITRFSVRLRDHHFQKKVNLFTEERLRQRLYYFKNIFLEGITSQKPGHPKNSLKEDEYKVIILIDADMPPTWKDILDDEIAEYENIFTYTWDLGKDNINNLDWLRSFMPELFDRDYLIQTRIDDDDAFGEGFMGTMHHWCDKIVKWDRERKAEDARHKFITFPDGNYIVHHHNSDGNYHVKKQRARCCGAGLTLINKSTRNDCIYKFDHSRISTNEEIRIFEKMHGTSMYVVTAHEQNDSSRYKNILNKLDTYAHFQELEFAVKKALES